MAIHNTCRLPDKAIPGKTYKCKGCLLVYIAMENDDDTVYLEPLFIEDGASDA